jgi:hypothetical protein
LCILSSSRIPHIDLEVTDPSFLKWFYHSGPEEKKTNSDFFNSFSINTKMVFGAGKIDR